MADFSSEGGVGGCCCLVLPSPPQGDAVFKAVVVTGGCQPVCKMLPFWRLPTVVLEEGGRVLGR